MRDVEVSLGSLLRLLQPGMPRVVPDQRRKFEEDELFRQLSVDTPVCYALHRDKPIAHRKEAMMQELRQGSLTVAMSEIGTTMRLVIDTKSWIAKPRGARIVTREEAKLDERGILSIRSRFIMNGVCVAWLGRIDTNSLSGEGRMQFDAERAEIENQLMKEQLLEYNRMHSRAVSVAMATEKSRSSWPSTRGVQQPSRSTNYNLPDYC